MGNVVTFLIYTDVFGKCEIIQKQFLHLILGIEIFLPCSEEGRNGTFLKFIDKYSQAYINYTKRHLICKKGDYLFPS
jgi:hypothetical protein